jgi:hypothetical protein
MTLDFNIFETPLINAHILCHQKSPLRGNGENEQGLAMVVDMTPCGQSLYSTRTHQIKTHLCSILAAMNFGNFCKKGPCVIPP